MNRLFTIAFLATAFFAQTAQAECYADYKAKKDRPLQLHYGVIQLDQSDCGSRRDAARAASRRLEAGGWTLLNILDIFGADQLERKERDAGSYFLRF
ncbi:hypothetical protein [Litoreibacter roseus]|uniref:Uncharacterized protein n=1 Tax=Litoreibacter roseus TaxID=2601869 RepID=A0A6N6JK53_9RHOB|nr:hypothetical protein [Litoreibacter roseus]GFE66240.1 hypothetical protein KIN_33140 [Litoreibacter roseus]